jgi:transposase
MWAWWYYQAGESDTVTVFQQTGEPSMLEVGQYMEIKELKSEGLSIRAIMKRTGLSRNTIRKVLRGEHTLEVAARVRVSKVEPYKAYLRERYERYQLSAVRLYDEIRSMGYTGSLPTVRRYLQPLKGPTQRLRKVTVRFETPPGKQAQVDWSECGRFTWAEGHGVTIHAFVMVLSYSRKMFVHFTTSMKMAELLRCHRLAFEYFGGWTAHILYDNMKQIRTGPGQLNEQFVDFAEHYGFVVKTHRAYRPRTKGKVERVMDYLKDNFLAGRTFESLDDLNAQAHHWLEHTANARVHGTTGKIPNEQWPLETLTPLHSRPVFEAVRAVKRSVNNEAMVHYHGSRYSVPPTYAGQTVMVHSEGGYIHVHCGDTIIAEHRAACSAGQCIVARDHVAELWKLTAQQVAVPSPPTGERWHLLTTPVVEAVPLSRFEEVIR